METGDVSCISLLVFQTIPIPSGVNRQRIRVVGQLFSLSGLPKIASSANDQLVHALYIQ